MAQVGLHALIALQSNRMIPHERGLYPSIIVGSILPDLDIILVAISSLFYSIERSTELFHRTFSHSFFSLIIVYLLFMIMAEVNRKSQLKTIGKGIAIGILLHIIVDTFLWFHGVHFLWPLPVNEFNLWKSVQIPLVFNHFLISFEFIFFRIYAWYLIKCYLKKPSTHGWFIKFITKWMKIESLLFIIFLIFTYFKIPNFIFLFGLAYIPSLIMAIISTLMMWHSIEPTQKEYI